MIEFTVYMGLYATSCLHILYHVISVTLKTIDQISLGIHGVSYPAVRPGLQRQCSEVIQGYPPIQVLAQSSHGLLVFAFWRIVNAKQTLP